MRVAPRQPLAYLVVTAPAIVMSPFVVVMFAAWLLAESLRIIADGLWSALGVLVARMNALIEWADGRLLDELQRDALRGLPKD